MTSAPSVLRSPQIVVQVERDLRGNPLLRDLSALLADDPTEGVQVNLMVVVVAGGMALFRELCFADRTSVAERG